MSYRDMVNALPPGKFMWAICSECGGDGKHAKGLGSFSMAELDEDPDFRDDYFAGAYDEPCGECDASGKVKVPRKGALSFGELRALALASREPDLRVPWYESCPIARAERLMGA